MVVDVEAKRSLACQGKFFVRGGKKIFLKAMRLDGVGLPLDFDAKLSLLKRFEKLKAAHTTGLVLDRVQADAVLDLAAQAGLPALIELELEPRELLDIEATRAAVERFGSFVRLFRGRQGLAGYVVNCPVTQDAVRAHGLGRVRRRLAAVISAIREQDGSVLVAVRHRGDTRALALLEEDFIYADVGSLAPAELRDYLVTLHNIAEARPVVVEFSQASPGQDAAVEIAFGTGAAGVVAAPVPAPVSGQWLETRTLKASETMPFVALNGTCPPSPARTPMVSVVICAYNAERTMRQCLDSLRRLDYPSYEVVIVDDGSSDRTAEIAAEFPEFRLIRQSNHGLSVARNVGLHAARGEIVAYTDSDCAVDEHWLTLMVRAMLEQGHAGCGGPNYAPYEDGRIEACVAASPGAPCHVLTGDETAEHLAGCNMVFRKEALLKIGGFAPEFTSAGDDVDICWRLLAEGFRLGYCPSAFVWHFRRNTVKAYFGQQRGYGRAEAMLYVRYPERFNLLGQIKWRGTIPGLARTVPGGGSKRVRWGAPSTGVQTLFDPVPGLVNFLPQTLEWSAAWTLVMLGCLGFGVSVLPAFAMLMLGPVWAFHYARRAPIEQCHDGLMSRLLVAYLAWTGPMVRGKARYKELAARNSNRGSDPVVRQRPLISLAARSLRLAYWSESYVTRDALLERVSGCLSRSRIPAVVDPGWNDFDLEARRGFWTRVQLRTADEVHAGGRVKIHVLARTRLSPLSICGLVIGFALATGALLFSTELVALVAGGLTVLFAAFALGAMIVSGRLLCRAVEGAATELGLIPLGRPSRAAARAARDASATERGPVLELGNQSASADCR